MIAEKEIARRISKMSFNEIWDRSDTIRVDNFEEIIIDRVSGATFRASRSVGQLHYSQVDHACVLCHARVDLSSAHDADGGGFICKRCYDSV